MSHWPVVSDETADRVAETFGDEGRVWLRNLPDVVGLLAERWHLQPTAVAFSGARASFVAPVTDRLGRAFVLKIAPGVRWLRYEYNALSHWNGRGAVRVADADLALGALLLDRLTPGGTLPESLEAPSSAAKIFASVVGQLARDTPPTPDLPDLESWLEKLDRPSVEPRLPQLEVERVSARLMSRTLLANSTHFGVLHGDLHHGNLLQHGSAWAAIDPKGLIGPLEAEPAAFLRNPRRHILHNARGLAWTTERARSIAEELRLELAPVLGWAYVLAVVGAQWSLEDGADVADADKWLRCAVVLKEAYEAEAL